MRAAGGLRLNRSVRRHQSPLGGVTDMRVQRMKYVYGGAAAAMVGAAALVFGSATAASAHFMCNDGSTTEVDDASVACQGHGGIMNMPSSPPTTMASMPGMDHGAPTTK